MPPGDALTETVSKDPSQSHAGTAFQQAANVPFSSGLSLPRAAKNPAPRGCGPTQRLCPPLHFHSNAFSGVVRRRGCSVAAQMCGRGRKMPPEELEGEGGERGPTGLALSYLHGGGLGNVWSSSNPIPFPFLNRCSILNSSTPTPNTAARSMTVTPGAWSQSWVSALPVAVLKM